MNKAFIIRKIVSLEKYDIGKFVKNVSSSKKLYHCSNCDKSVSKYYKYCPYCGSEFVSIKDLDAKKEG